MSSVSTTEPVHAIEVPPGTPAQEHSYGLILLRLFASPDVVPSSSPTPTTQNTQVLLIHQKTALPVNERPYFWSFPKGHAEDDDASPLDTAIREVKEETGLSISKEHIFFKYSPGILPSTQAQEDSEVVDGAKSFAERYINPRKGWVKEARYWAALVSQDIAEKSIVIQEKELADAKWCGWDEARNLLSFERGKGVLREVGDRLDSLAEWERENAQERVDEER